MPDRIYWNYCHIGGDRILERDEANQIIEEIIQVLKKHKLTVKVAKELLNTTISSLEDEALV